MPKISLLAVLLALGPCLPGCGCGPGDTRRPEQDGDADSDTDADTDADSDTDPDGLCYDLDCDGYGLGLGCRGPDCDETDPGVAAGCGADNCGADGIGTDCPCDRGEHAGPVPCWTGDEGVEGVGVCRAGERWCAADGRWGPCSGQLPRCGGEECNYLDDDCDGDVDEGVREADESCPEDDGHCFGPDCPDGESLCDDPEAMRDDVVCGPEGWLELSSETTAGGYIWIANSAEDTVSKLDTDTGDEVGRFYTGDPDDDPDPSRTSVGISGAVYVGNRARYDYEGGMVDPVPPDGPTRGASVTKIAAEEADCADANGDGEIETSGDSTPLRWGDDECVLWTAPVGDPGCTLRAVAAGVDVVLDGAFDERVYAGCFTESMIYVLDGASGVVVDEIPVPGVKPYGFALSPDGLLFVASLSGSPLGAFVPAAAGTDNVGIVDLNADPPTVRNETPPICNGLEGVGGAGGGFFDTGISTYGIAADAEGNLWSCNMFWGCLYRYDVEGDEWTKDEDVNACRGLAVDQEGFVWTGEGLSGQPTSTVMRVDPDSMDVLGRVETPGSVGVGVAVDWNGYVWLVHKMSDTVSKIDPDDLEVVGTYDVGSVPYTYSDMTGVQLDNVLPMGHYRRRHQVCFGENESTRWISLTLDAEVPIDTAIAVRGRAAEDDTELAAAEWLGLAVIELADPLVVFLDRLPFGRFLELEFELRGDPESGRSPSLHGYTLEADCLDNPG